MDGRTYCVRNFHAHENYGTGHSNSNVSAIWMLCMDDMKRPEKKSTTIIRLITGALILISSGVTAYARLVPIPQSIMTFDSNRTDRLFDEMGVLKVPHIAPPVDIILQDLDANTVRMSDLKGKIVLLSFGATWSMACQVEMYAMEKLHKRLKDKNFTMVAISTQEPADRVRQFVKKSRLSFTVLLDPEGDIGSQFGVISIPTTYILSKDGSIIGLSIGFRRWDSEDAIALLKHLIDNGMEPSFQGTWFKPFPPVAE